MEIPIKNAKVRNISSKKQPVYAIPVPVDYVKNGLLDLDGRYDVVIVKRAEAGQEAENGTSPTWTSDSGVIARLRGISLRLIASSRI